MFDIFETALGIFLITVSLSVLTLTVLLSLQLLGVLNV